VRLGGQTISMMFGSQTHNGFAIVKEMKDTSQHCCVKTMDDIVFTQQCCEVSFVFISRMLLSE